MIVKQPLDRHYLERVENIESMTNRLFSALIDALIYIFVLKRNNYVRRSSFPLFLMLLSNRV